MNTSPVNTSVPPHEPANHSVVAPTPFVPPVTVSVVLFPLQIVVVPVAPLGAVEEVLNVILALEVDVSPAGTLSACAFTVAVPLVPFEVNNAVAVPLVCIVVCSPERLPNVVGPHVTANPASAERSAAAITSPSELFRKLAVIVEVFPLELQIVFGDAVTFNCNHGVASRFAPLALSQAPAAVGPVLQPHQLFSALTLPADPTR